LYDTATNYSKNVAAQADWNANWQAKIDPIIQQQWPPGSPGMVP
jgi:hypothetical protein